MKASVDSLCLMAEGRKIAVLGDMLELGEAAASLTEQVGKYTAEKGIDILLAAGGYAESLVSGFRSAAGGAQAECFDSREALEERLTGVIRKGDTVLFKASRAMQLEEIFNAVRESIQ